MKDAKLTRYDYLVHPLATLFPPLPSAEYEELKTSIQKNGQYEPITLGLDGTSVLDGHHRLRACQELGIEPRFELFEKLRDATNRKGGEQKSPEFIGQSEADYIWLKNVLRRHLTDAQRAALAHRWFDEIRKAGKERRLSMLKRGKTLPVLADAPKREPIRSRKAIAARSQVSEHAVRQVEHLAKHAPELLPKVESGELKLNEALKQTRVLVEVQTPPESRGSQNVIVSPDYLFTARSYLDSAGTALEKLTQYKADYADQVNTPNWKSLCLAISRVVDAAKLLGAFPASDEGQK